MFLLLLLEIIQQVSFGFLYSMQIIVKANMSVSAYGQLGLEELRDLFSCPEVCPHCEVFDCLSYLGFMSATSVTGQPRG